MTILFSFAVLLSFQCQAQNCHTTVDWDVSPISDYPDTDTVNICVDVDGSLGGDWLHGVSISLPDAWELISGTSDEECGDGEWIFVEDPPNPSLGPGYYYDANTGGPQDGDPFNNFGAAACSTVTFCFQVKMVTITAEILNEIGDDTSLSPSVSIIGDSRIMPIWGGPICSWEDVTHYLDLNVPPIFNGQELTGEFELNPSLCAPESVELELLSPDTDLVVETRTASVNADGSFSTFIDSYGEYDIRMSHTGLLSQKLWGVNLEGGIIELEPFAVFPGDLNGDNQVNIVDISFMSLGFGTNEDDPFFYSPIDLNCDGIINIVDVSVLAASFGMEGE